MSSTKMIKPLETYKYLIIGASQAGLTAALELRNLDPEGTIGLISEEKGPLYKRTKLSKVLYKALPEKLEPLYTEEWYRANRIDLVHSTRAVHLDIENKNLEISGKQHIGFTKLLIATGARPAKLKISGEKYIHYLRNWDDAKKISSLMDKAKKVAIIGSGVEGIELVDQMNRAHKKVLLISQDSGPMVKWLDNHQQRELTSIMSERSVSQHYKESLQSIEKKRKTFDLLTETHHFHADLILASTGIKANIGLLEPYEEILQKKNYDLQKGIPVNLYMATPFEDIYAAGDVVFLPSDYPQGLWHAAQYQGQIAARNMTGRRQKLEKRSFRLKAEVFDQYYFSQNFSAVDPSSQGHILIDKKGSYLRAFSANNKVYSVVMTNRKDIAKLLQKQIQDGESLDSLQKIL